MVKKIIDLLNSQEEDKIKRGFRLLNRQDISLTEKIQYLNASKYRMLIDPLVQYFNRPGNRLYFIDKRHQSIEYFNLGDQYYLPN